MTDPVLKPCPQTPNCVSSQAPEGDTVHWIAPVHFDGDEQEALTAVKAALLALPRTRITDERAREVRAVSSSRVFRFKDNVQVIVSDGRIDMRSAARMGGKDFGVNRKRMETFSADVQARLGDAAAS